MLSVDMCCLQIRVIIYIMMIYIMIPPPLIHADICDIVHVHQGEHFRTPTHWLVCSHIYAVTAIFRLPTRC